MRHTRQEVPLVGSRPPPAVDTSARRIGGPLGILRLQRQAGNGAVATMLGRSSVASGGTSTAGLSIAWSAAGAQPDLRLQLYEAGEHAQVGSTATVMVNGVALTQGELNAMGDFFESPSALRAATAAELTKLRDLIQRDVRVRTGQPRPGEIAVSTKEWEDATSKRYLKLAAANRAHFAPGSSANAENYKNRWHDLHKQALLQAELDGRVNGKQVSDNAKVINGFGAHFLVDAFSAGHLVNKQQITDLSRKRWDAMATTGWIFKETSFTKAVSHAVVNDPVAGAKLRQQELKMLEWGPVTASRFSEFLWQVAKKDPDKFFNAFARVVHDQLDDAMKGPGTGVEVINDKGTTWNLSGDETLKNSAESLRIMNEAATQAEKNLEVAALGNPDVPTLSAQVWAYTPRPTKSGEEMITRTVEAMTDLSQPGAVRAFSDLTIAQIETAIDELTAMGYMRPRPSRAARWARGSGD
jgi:hypothetical protein